MSKIGSVREVAPFQRDHELLVNLAVEIFFIVLMVLYRNALNNKYVIGIISFVEHQTPSQPI